MTYAILTFGCRVNQADSFELEEGLRTRGAVEAPADAADLIIVNTCSVTGAADQGARRAIRGLSRDNPSARIVVTGCYATRKPGDLDQLPNVLMVVPNQKKDGLLRLLDEESVFATRDRFGEGDGSCGAGVAPGAMGRTAYPLRVQTGCDQTCAFCIIPFTRGPSRSRPLVEIRDEVHRVAAAGYKEVWLVGVHLGSFGRDLQPATSLVELLRDLDRQPGDTTFRISSLEPMDCPQDVVDLVARSGRFAPHFHLPLQHASDRVLRVMRRPYTLECYRDLVDQIHARLPHASIGSDLIVGFPGESDQDMEMMAREVERLPFSYLHVFPYSDRPGTDATVMTPKVDAARTKTRARRLRDVARRLTDRFVASQIGSVRPGLTLDDGTVVLTDNFLKVRIPPGLPRNTRVRVRIDSPALDGTVEGAGRAPAPLAQW
ncbi:MAG: tRNA (N(6)-L-threonylcarbamoyladenosine(37)-C(2))-methylthiotransferase MtaB [Acidobacteria bacterium]|nr:tRNA (N(6)-L-threonylcarbamoyladenosine(37)-C(2))-methylthiotransferase MtaB [Acidobacteriota bacterium]